MAYTILITFTCFYLLANIVRGESPTTTITTLNMVQNMSNPLDQVPYVQIDSEGVFKYILIKVSLDGDLHGNAPYKIIVRGKQYAKYHADIYEEECDKLYKLGLNCECLGGGRIKHDPGSKKILVYGYSQAFGRANHMNTVEILKEAYKNYHISFTNNGY